jgi:hypothetical protein
MGSATSAHRNAIVANGLIPRGKGGAPPPMRPAGPFEDTKTR